MLLIFIVFGLFVVMIIVFGIVSYNKRKRDHYSPAPPQIILKNQLENEKKNPGQHLCLTCHGTGHVKEKCPHCFGHRKQACTSCGGSGRKQQNVIKFGKPGFESVICMTCGGSGRQNCFACGGSGFKHGTSLCKTCHGSGRV